MALGVVSPDPHKQSGPASWSFSCVSSWGLAHLGRSCHHCLPARLPPLPILLWGLGLPDWACGYLVSDNIGFTFISALHQMSPVTFSWHTRRRLAFLDCQRVTDVEADCVGASGLLLIRWSEQGLLGERVDKPFHSSRFKLISNPLPEINEALPIFSLWWGIHFRSLGNKWQSELFSSVDLFYISIMPWQLTVFFLCNWEIKWKENSQI